MTTPALDEIRLEQFASKVAADQNVAIAGVLAYIGDRLGIWASLAASGQVDPDDLAEITGLDPTYLSEWLAAQTAAGYVVFDPETGRFDLPAEHVMVLADEESPVASAGGFEFLAGCWADADRVADAFVTGGGVPSGERDGRLHRGVARFFRPLYRQSIVHGWLPSLDGVVESLEAGARVLDVGSGQGYPTLLMAEAYPSSTFVGIDPDDEAVAKARSSARQLGFGNVTFQIASAGEVTEDEWDLICFFDAFHHLGDPRAVATWAKRVLAPEGAVMLVEPLAGDSLAENLAMAGSLYYSPSTLLCLPDALSQAGGCSLGAQAGPARLTGLLRDAGFRRVRVAAITDFNLIIEARV